MISFERSSFSSRGWDSMLSECDYPSHLQSYLYGEAKAISEGWQVDRYIIKSSREKVAAVQIMKKKMFGFFSIYRINRGPFWLKKDVPIDTKYQIYKKLRSRYKIFKLELLFIAPNEICSKEIDSLFDNLKFKVRTGRQNSILIDLDKNLEDLRANLHSKWRNQLKKSENEGVNIRLRSDTHTFTFLMTKYESMKKVKGFDGPSECFLETLFSLNCGTSNLLVTAEKEDEVIGILYIYLYGKAANYLIGWSSAKGRKYNVSNLLLWEAIKKLKEGKSTILDLGGINEEKAGSIARFKKRMGGASFTTTRERLWF